MPTLTGKKVGLWAGVGLVGRSEWPTTHTHTYTLQRTIPRGTKTTHPDTHTHRGVDTFARNTETPLVPCSGFHSVYVCL